LAGKASVNVGGRRKVKFGDDKEDVVTDDEDDNDDDEEASDDSEASDEENEDDEGSEESGESSENDSDADSADDVGTDSDDDENKFSSVLKAKKRKMEESTAANKKIKTSDVGSKFTETEQKKNKAPGPPAKPRSEMTLKELNKDILREMGDEDDHEEEEEEEEEEGGNADTVSSNKGNIGKMADSSPVKTPEPRAGSKTAAGAVANGAGQFHHRLATRKDMDNHSKVAEALRKIGSTPSAQDKSGGMKNKPEEESEVDENDSDDEVEKSEEEEEEEEMKNEKEGEEEEEEEEEVSLRWKSDLATKARDAFYARQSSTANLRKLVYGQQQVSTKVVFRYWLKLLRYRCLLRL
jgi:hypothetical protein